MFCQTLLTQEEAKTCNIKVFGVHFPKEKRRVSYMATAHEQWTSSTVHYHSLLKAGWAIARLTVTAEWTRFVPYLTKLFQFLPVKHNGRILGHR